MNIYKNYKTPYTSEHIKPQNLFFPIWKDKQKNDSDPMTKTFTNSKQTIKNYIENIQKKYIVFPKRLELLFTDS